MMKKNIKYILILFLMQISIAWANCPLLIFGEKVEPSPMTYKEDGNISVYAMNITGNEIPLDDGTGNPSCVFDINLTNIVLKENDLSLVTAKNSLGIDILDTYFALDYNTTTTIFTLTQKINLPDDFAFNIFVPVLVTEQSLSSSPHNGFRMTVNTTERIKTKYTYTTDIPLEALNDESMIIDGDVGGIAITNIVENDRINHQSVALGDDVTIKEINNAIPLIIQSSDGSVTVPSGTLGGRYEAQYTLCETFNPEHCSDANITVYVRNHEPIAQDDTINIAEDTRVNIAPLLNDTDADNNTLKIVSITQPTHGIVAINADQITVQYRPDNSYNGFDSFTYIVTDGEGGTDEANISIEINGTNVAPNAMNDENTTNEDTAITMAVLTNDEDTDGDTISIISKTLPAHGSVVTNDDETFTYTPDENYYGIDIFTYTITDGEGHTDSGVVTVNVLSINDLPIAIDDNTTTIENKSVTINVLENDRDVESNNFLTISTTEPKYGSIVINLDGTITYTPNEDFNGSDVFEYTMQDEDNATDIAKVTISVIDNQAPQTRDDTFTAAVGETITIDVLENDNDEDNATDITSIKIIGADTNGVLTVAGEGVWRVNGEGGITFTPEEKFIGDPQPIEYTVSDDLGNVSAPAKVTVNYIQENPQAVDDSVASFPGETEVIKVLENDTDDQYDIDASRLRIVDTKSGARMTKLYVYDEGTWNVDKYGTITFVPVDAFMHSPTPIFYEVSDRAGHTSKQAKVSIGYPVIEPTITPIPTATPEPIATPKPKPTVTATPKPIVTATPRPKATATPHPTATPAPKAPVAKGCSIKANNDLDVKITSNKGTVIGVLVNDGCVASCGKITFTQGAHGTVSIDDGGTPNNLQDDVLVYTPEANLCDATDSFQYTVTDCNGNSSTATVTLDIACSSTQTSDGDAMNKMGMIFMVLMMVWIGLISVRKEENSYS